ncbi:MAG: NADH-quinone oxidoreductase subunit N, partial [Actinomycetota bacterium]|nr:NADH-quinone oxidoreductase subunit N [Actinomycetota bacterium]
LILGLAGDELTGSPRESETYALLLFSTTGALVLSGADDLLVLAVGFLLASIPVYALVGLARSRAGAEAAMKTYLVGALFGIVLLLGVTILYAVAGGTAYPELRVGLTTAPHAAVATGVVAVLAGLMFEAGGVPAHFWVPDAAEASTGVTAAFLTTVPKVGALVAAFRLVSVLPDGVAWPLLVALLAAGSMTLGNLAAYWQHDPRRLLGWSTVGQVGFLLVPVAVAGRSPLALPALLFYLAAYALTNVAAFAVTTALPARRDLADYRGLVRAHPWLAGALVVALLGLVGTPPTGVFVGKLTVATAGWEGGMAWLAVLLLVNTLLSLFYYLRWIAPAVRSDRAARGVATRREEASATLPWSGAVAVVAAALSLAVGVSAALLWGLLDGSLMA